MISGELFKTTVDPDPVDVAVITNVPLPVMLEGVLVRNDGRVKPIVESVLVVHKVSPAPSVVKNCPLVPRDGGSVRL